MSWSLPFNARDLDRQHLACIYNRFLERIQQELMDCHCVPGQLYW